ncbi:hypothetical protein [Ranid herpesvirus 3]|uniref:Uncharacterized protein n=1 Tax=Ranid herpesvirus 3 TaxID=1987509 RepID=A0A1X9T5M7_9VIRU|nr:hypothetical protein [Ranid herpesvirus 3]ARR28975.1 hypothetical protein [Ranid herpesvirus 3]
MTSHAFDQKPTLSLISDKANIVIERCDLLHELSSLKLSCIPRCDGPPFQLIYYWRKQITSAKQRLIHHLNKLPFVPNICVPCYSSKLHQAICRLAEAAARYAAFVLKVLYNANVGCATSNIYSQLLY